MTKSPHQSKTIISAAFGLVITASVAFGIVTQEEAKEIGALIAELIPAVLTLCAFAGTIYGRFKAKGDIKLP